MRDEETPYYTFFTTTSTGNAFSSESAEIIDCKFDKFIVKIKLDENGRFIDIVEIKEARDFRSLKQILASKNYFDIEKYAVDDTEE